MHGSVGEGAGTAGASRAEGRRRTEAARAGGSCRHRPLRLRRHFDQVLLFKKPKFLAFVVALQIAGLLGHCHTLRTLRRCAVLCTFCVPRL